MPPVSKAFALDMAWINAVNNLNSSPASIESKEPLEFLRGIRDQLKDNFPVFDEKTDQETEGVDHDNIKHNICCIRNLLTLNEDILSRCMNHVVSTGEETKLARFGFEGVRTNQEGNLLEMSHRQSELHKHLTRRPYLALLLVSVTLSWSSIDRHRILSTLSTYSIRRCWLLLNDVALHYLLPMLKEHLEDAQVCLGGIRHFFLFLGLIEGNDAIDFLS
jgi:hypothetical protein